MNSNDISEAHQKRLSIVGGFLKELRLGGGLTQAELRQYTNIHLNTIQRIEHGRNITLLSLFELIDCHGYSLSEFFEGME